MNKHEFYQRLSNLTSTFQATCLVDAYEQTHRHYHTIEHLIKEGIIEIKQTI